MKTIIKFLCVLTLVFGLSSCGYERVDAGHEGIKVNLYGDGKGVDDISLVTGAVYTMQSMLCGILTEMTDILTSIR